jgi:hypothetical protein
MDRANEQGTRSHGIPPKRGLEPWLYPCAKTRECITGICYGLYGARRGWGLGPSPIFLQTIQQHKHKYNVFPLYNKHHHEAGWLAQTTQGIEIDCRVMISFSTYLVLGST